MEKERKDIPKSFVNWFKNHFAVDLDKVDVYAEYDRTLSQAENKEIFVDKFSTYYFDSKTEQKEKMRVFEEQQRKAEFDNRILEMEGRFGIKINFVG